MEKEKLQKMQILEQNLQAILMQKQTVQMDLSETVEAIKEVENSEDEVYKIAGQLMIKTKKEKISEELKDKEKMLETRLNTLDSQEKKFTEEANKIRNELMNKEKNKK